MKPRRLLGLGAVVLGVCVVLFLSQIERGSRGMELLEPDPELAEPLPAELGLVSTMAEEPSERAESVAPERVESEESVAQPEPTLRVFVGDAFEGRPIAGARVTLFDRAAPRTSTTDERGGALVPMLSTRKTVRLRIEAEGYCVWSREGTPMPSVAAFLLPGTTLAGRVLAADTLEPVGGAVLALVSVVYLEGVLHEESLRVIAAKDGSYELGPVPLRFEATLEIRAEGFATTRRVFELRRDEPRCLQDVHLVRGFPIRGRVEDWVSGRGLAGARVGDLTADAEGGFEGPVLTRPATTWASLEIGAPEYAILQAQLDVAPFHAAPFGAASGGENELVFRLPHLATLEGEVRSADGPVSDVFLSCRADGPLPDGPIQDASPLYELPEGWFYTLDAPPARSDGEGRYRIPVLPWGLNLVAEARCAGFESETIRFLSMGEPDSVRRVDWWLKSAAAERTILRGVVRLNGQGCAGFDGAIAWQGASRSWQEGFAGGVFQIDVEPGDVRLRATLDICPELPSAETLVHVVRGAQQSIDLDVLAPIAPIRGRMLFKDLNPVVGCEVVATCKLPLDQPECVLSYRAATNEQGDFELFVPDIGLEFTLETKSRGGFWLSKGGIRPWATGVDFLFDSAFQVFLRATEGRTGAVLEFGRQIRFLSARAGGRFWELEPESTYTDADGWLEFWLKGEDVQVVALPVAEELQLDSPRARFAPGTRAQHHEFVLSRGLAQQVELDSEPWPEGHELWLVEEDLWAQIGSPYDRSPIATLSRQRSVRFDASGHATLHGLVPGLYRFKVRPEDVRIDPEFVRIDEPPRLLTLRLLRDE